MTQWVVVSTAEDNGEQQTFGPYRSIAKATTAAALVILGLGHGEQS